MRQEYRQIIFKKIKERQLAYLARQSLKLPLVWLGSKVGRPLTGPLQAVLIVTYRCNLKCGFCSLWQRPGQEKRKELSTRSLKKVIGDLAALRTTGVGFTGGEPLLRPDIFQLIKHASGKGMTTHLATNGLLLTPENIRALLASGLDAISVSLDSVDPKIHDQMRGQKDAFKQMTANLKKLVRARKKSGSNLSVVVNCAVSGVNLNSVLGLVPEVKKWGIDGLGFIPVQSSGFGRFKGDYRGKYQVKDKQVAEKLVGKLIQFKKDQPDLIDNSLNYLRTFQSFFAGKPLPIKCLVGYHTTVIDAYGDIFACLPDSNLNRPLANLKDGPIKLIWSSPTYQKARRKTGHCRDCYWNCHTELSLMLNSGIRESLN